LPADAGMGRRALLTDAASAQVALR
jgi:hypothetical protein